MTKVVIKAADGVGAVDLYHNANLKIETTADGVKILDNVKYVAGTGNDLQIYHNGSTSLIEDSIGDFRLRSNALKLQAAGGANYVHCTSGGAVQIYYDNAKKLETNANGCLLGDNVKLQLGSAGDLEILHDGSNSYIQEDGTGQIIIRGWSPRLQAGYSPTSGRSTGEDAVVCITDGAVELYHNAIKTLETDANGAKVLGPEGGSANLYLYGDEGDDNNDKWVFIAYDGEFSLQNYTSGSWEKNIECNGNGAVELYYDNSKKLHTVESGIYVTGQSKGVCTNNLAINGDMKICQRHGTSTVTSGNTYVTDRWRLVSAGTNENPTMSRHDLTLADDATVWNEGFKYSFHVQNGNQTSTGAGDYMYIQQKIEASMIRHFGWVYTSSTSWITISYWVKSSVAQTFYGYIQTNDGSTKRAYTWSTGALSADTWTKVTATIPGDSNIQVDDNNAAGLVFQPIALFWGTDYTDNTGGAVGTWRTWDGAEKTPDYTDTWWDTDNATFEITGVQFEVGKVANDFLFEPYSETLRKCERYYYKIPNLDWRTADGQIATNQASGTYALPVGGPHPTTMRANPTVTLSNMTYSNCSFDSLNANGRHWGMRVEAVNDTHFRITTGEATVDCEL